MNAPIFLLPNRPAWCTAALLAAALAVSGCVSTKYKMARENTPPTMLLNLTAAQPPLAAALNVVIIYQGPGSWKRAAFWDEYVVTIANGGDQPLTIASAELIDPAGANQALGTDPWALEKRSKTLEQKYRDAGVAFARNAAGVVVIAGAGVGGVAAAGGIFAAGAGAAAAASVVAVPIYFLAVASFNNDNKAGIVTEFNRRRFVLPLTLAPGETRIGSLFFPMIPSPRALTLRWSGSTTGDVLTLRLDSLRGLHVKVPAPASAGQ